MMILTILGGLVLILVFGLIIALTDSRKDDKYPHHAANCGCGYHRKFK